jgi:catechol 2,3-dioxygenase-like lactoylglutathione lyase family enzyme
VPLGRDTKGANSHGLLEVVVVPVSDIDRAKEFYVGTLGFHLDADVQPTPDMRVRGALSARGDRSQGCPRRTKDH